jgi:hypothetical protein
MTSTSEDLASSSPVAAIIKELRRSPVFHLSLASKELFHSNFLAWLCEQYPDQAARVFANLLGRPTVNCYPDEVYREWKNIDLFIKCRDGTEIVVENKVRSLPSRLQLVEYSSKPKAPERAGFLLLSLVPPAFPLALDNGTVWHHADYGQFAEQLNSVVPEVEARDQYHGNLLQDYIGFIRRLDLLRKDFIEYQTADYFGVNDHLQHLKNIRMHDVFDKLRSAELVRRVGAILMNDGFEVVHQNLPSGRPGQIGLSAGMTRGSALFDLKYVLTKTRPRDDPVYLGIQLQGRQFRLNLEMNLEDRNKKRAGTLAPAVLQPANGKRIWFDFRYVSSDCCTPHEYPRERDFNQYSKTFYYRYKKLTSISPKKLAEAIIAYARLIREHESVLRRQIEAAL